MLLRLRRCAYQPLNIHSLMGRVTCSQINSNSSTTFNAKHNRHAPTSSSKRVEPSNELMKENPIEVTYKFPDKQSVISQLLEYQKQNKHIDVLEITNFLKKKEIAFIDNEVISLTVTSALASRLPVTIISLIDFAYSMDISYNPEFALTYIRACRDCPMESHPGMWSKAVGMLEIVLSENGMTDKRELTNRKLVETCLEETLLLCAISGKWRNVLEIMEKTLANDLSPTERMLNAGGLCCAREQNGIGQAYGIFNYMIAENITRTRKFYLALLQSHVRAKLFDKYEFIWAQLLIDNISRTDALCATRIDMLGAIGEVEKAELVLEESLLSIKRPKLTYNALYLALLRSGNTAKALDLVKKMRETGVQPPEQHTSSFHVQSLAKVGLVEEGLRFLRKQELDCAEVGVVEVVKITSPEDSVTSVPLVDEEELGFVSESAWQSLFRASLAHEKFSVAQELFDFALERQVTRRTKAHSSTAQVDTTLWVSQLFRSLGKAGKCAEAIHVAEKYQPLSHADLSILLKVLCQNMEEGEAIKFHQKTLDRLCSPDAQSAKVSSSSGNATKMEKYLRAVTHGFVQQLASEHKGDSVIEVFDGVHAAIQRLKALHRPVVGPSPQTASDRKANTAYTRLKASLPMMYTSAIRYTVGSKLSLDQAQKLMDHQRKFDVTPMWSCTRYAIKVMSEVEAWDLLLEVFASRTQTSDYMPADEVAYTRALTGCSSLGRWQDSIEILAHLLSETDKPGPAVFELTLEALVAAEQWETMTEIVALVRETQVTPTPRMIALCSGDMPAALREQLLRKIRDVQYCDITMVEDGKGSHGQGQGGQGRPSHSKGKNIPQKPKTVKKMNKTEPKLPPNDAPIPTAPEAQIAQLQPELKRPPNAKKIKVKC